MSGFLFIPPLALHLRGSGPTGSVLHSFSNATPIAEVERIFAALWQRPDLPSLALQRREVRVLANIVVAQLRVDPYQRARSSIYDRIARRGRGNPNANQRNRQHLRASETA
jgi:molybdopterin biosynthesis enzyme